MKNRDWLFIDENRIHNFRSAGVLLIDGKILIQRSINDTEFALPGGHVAWGETSANALIREYKEEIGLDIEVDRLIWIEEAFWKWGKRETHTICHYHLVKLNNKSQIPKEGIFKSLESDESKLLFQWVNIDELQNYKVYPVFLKNKITNLSDGIEHFISDQIHGNNKNNKNNQKIDNNEKIYNKLVRDCIPDIIKKQGNKYKLHIADDVEYKNALLSKLNEETQEFIEFPCEEEIADILEVVEALANCYGFSNENINIIKNDKSSLRGKFNNKIILEKVIHTKKS